jgi:hypothetical protein
VFGNTHRCARKYGGKKNRGGANTGGKNVSNALVFHG